MKAPRWSVRQVNTKKGTYAIVEGLAYNKLIKGANPTKRISSLPNDPKRFYHDNATRLTTDDLDDLDGAEGAPLCVEHKGHDVVGHVHHSYLDDGDHSKGWHIMARIPLNDRGKRVVADIKAGKLNGFSVGYSNVLGGDDYRTVDYKKFREISLVNEPFFDGCKLNVSVNASSDNGTSDGKF